MTGRATGEFTVRLTPQGPSSPEAERAGLGRLAIDKTFAGDLEATSAGEMLSAGTAVEGSAGYVALERVVGSLADRAGSFVLQHTGTMARGTPSLSVTVVPDSGTDGLTGLTGTMTIDREGGAHRYGFDYTLPEA